MEPEPGFGRTQGRGGTWTSNLRQKLTSLGPPIAPIQLDRLRVWTSVLALPLASARLFPLVPEGGLVHSAARPRAFPSSSGAAQAPRLLWPAAIFPVSHATPSRAPVAGWLVRVVPAANGIDSCIRRGLPGPYHASYGNHPRNRAPISRDGHELLPTCHLGRARNRRVRSTYRCTPLGVGWRQQLTPPEGCLMPPFLSSPTPATTHQTVPACGRPVALCPRTTTWALCSTFFSSACKPTSASSQDSG
jgi:hypothetical protein